MALTESRLRQIIRQETGRVLREAGDPRLDTKDIDQPAWKIIRGLGMPEIQEIYPEASDLRHEMERLKRDFDEGMAVVRPSKGGGSDEFDIFLSYSSPEPINDTPIPRRAFGKMGVSLDNGGQLSSADARRRGIKGF